MTSASEISLQELVGKGYADFWRFKGRYRVVKGSRASKKSKTAALWFISQMMKYPKANTLVVRMTYSTIKDSCFTELKWAIKRLGVEGFWKKRESPLEMEYLPTGQKIYFRGMDDPLKITSITVDVGVLCWCWVEEAYEIEDEKGFNRLDESIRGEAPAGYFKQITLTFNPWDRNHWLKARFFDRASSPDIFVKTTNYLCNEFLDAADLRVFEEMKNNDPERYKVAGLGEWGIAEGQFFSQWRESLHVVTPFAIPRGWMRFRSMDWGSYRPYACLWFAVDYDGNLWGYRELYGWGGKANVGAKETAAQVARRIADAEAADEKIDYAVLDNACWAKTGVTGPTIAEEMNHVLYKAGRTLFGESSKGREMGAEAFRMRLVGYTNSKKEQIPAIRFFSTCLHTIRTVPMLTHDPRQPEKYNTNGEDHCADAIVYACLSRPYTPVKAQVDKYAGRRRHYVDDKTPSVWSV